MNYVPKFLAAAIIGHNPEQFGFKVQADDVLDEVALVDVPNAVRLSHIAKVTGVSLAELKKYNPHLRRGMTPPGKKNYEIWVPKAKEQVVASAFNSLKSYRVANARTYSESSGNTSFHRIRRGETLAKIARKYGTSIRNLKRWNNIRGSKILVGRKLRVKRYVLSCYD